MPKLFASIKSGVTGTFTLPTNADTHLRAEGTNSLTLMRNTTDPRGFILGEGCYSSIQSNGAMAFHFPSNLTPQINGEYVRFVDESGNVIAEVPTLFAGTNTTFQFGDDGTPEVFSQDSNLNYLLGNTQLAEVFIQTNTANLTQTSTNYTTDYTFSFNGRNFNKLFKNSELISSEVDPNLNISDRLNWNSLFLKISDEFESLSSLKESSSLEAEAFVSKIGTNNYTLSIHIKLSEADESLVSYFALSDIHIKVGKNFFQEKFNNEFEFSIYRSENNQSTHSDGLSVSKVVILDPLNINEYSTPLVFDLTENNTFFKEGKQLENQGIFEIHVMGKDSTIDLSGCIKGFSIHQNDQNATGLTVKTGTASDSIFLSENHSQDLIMIDATHTQKDIIYGFEAQDKIQICNLLGLSGGRIDLSSNQIVYTPSGDHSTSIVLVEVIGASLSVANLIYSAG